VEQFDSFISFGRLVFPFGSSLNSLNILVSAKLISGLLWWICLMVANELEYGGFVS
jgi:hypothetical protein